MFKKPLYLDTKLKLCSFLLFSTFLDSTPFRKPILDPKIRKPILAFYSVVSNIDMVCFLFILNPSLLMFQFKVSLIVWKRSYISFNTFLLKWKKF